MVTPNLSTAFRFAKPDPHRFPCFKTLETIKLGLVNLTHDMIEFVSFVIPRTVDLEGRLCLPELSSGRKISLPGPNASSMTLRERYQPHPLASLLGLWLRLGFAAASGAGLEALGGKGATSLSVCCSANNPFCVDLGEGLVPRMLDFA